MNKRHAIITYICAGRTHPIHTHFMLKNINFYSSNKHCKPKLYENIIYWYHNRQMIRLGKKGTYLGQDFTKITIHL